MPEVKNEGNYETYRQCEIRSRVSEEEIEETFSFLELDKDEVSRLQKTAYRFDIVWLKDNIASKDKRLLDEDDREWVVFEVYGSKLMPRYRKDFRCIVR
jgi:hypothetical protein